METDAKNTNSNSKIAAVAAIACCALISAAYIGSNFSSGMEYRAFAENLYGGLFDYMKTVSLFGILRAAAHAAFAIVYFISMLIAGRLISGWMRVSFGSIMTAVPACIGLGAGAYSMLYLFLGIAGVLQKWVFVPVIAAPFIVIAVSPGMRMADAGLALRAFKKISGSPGTVLIVIMVIIYALIGFAGGLTPPTDADARMYHLALPDLYLKAGRIHYIPYILHSNWPLGNEMHLMAAMGTAGILAARAINAGFILASALAVAGLARTRFAPVPSTAAAAVFISIPIIQSHFLFSNIEPALAFYELLAFAMFLKWRDTRDVSHAAMCGLFCGFAMAVKLNGFVFCAALLALLTASLISGRRHGGAKTALAFIIPAAMPVLPWIIRSWIWTGNPVWPFFYSVFGGKNWSALNARDYMFYLTNFFGSPSFSGLAKSIPGLLTGQLFLNSGIALIALAPVMFLSKRSRRPALFLLSAAAALFIFWYVSSPQPRFLYPAIGIACAAAAAAFEAMPRASTVVLLLALAFHSVPFASAYSRNIPFALGSAAASEFYAGDELFLAYGFVNGLPADSKIMLLWTSEGLFCPRDYVWGDPFDQGYIRYGSDMSETRRRLEAEGITHVLFHRPGLASKEKLDRLLRKKLDLADNDPSTIFSAIPYQNAMIKSGAWKPVFISPAAEYYIFEITAPPDR